MEAQDSCERARPPRCQKRPREIEAERREPDRGKPYALPSSVHFLISREVYSESHGVSKQQAKRKGDFPRVRGLIPNHGEWPAPGSSDATLPVMRIECHWVVSPPGRYGRWSATARIRSSAIRDLLQETGNRSVDPDARLVAGESPPTARRSNRWFALRDALGDESTASGHVGPPKIVRNRNSSVCALGSNVHWCFNQWLPYASLRRQLSCNFICSIMLSFLFSSPETHSLTAAIESFNSGLIQQKCRVTNSSYLLSTPANFVAGT